MRYFKIFLGFLLIAALFNFIAPQISSAATQAGKIYIEAEGSASAPSGVTGAQAMALARRGAIADLQRNILKKLSGLNQGFIKGVELLKGEWNGEIYRLIGRVSVKNAAGAK